MSYQYPIDLKALWSERAQVFRRLGVPSDEVDRLASKIDDMWADRPGGWCYEWSRLAATYAAAGRADLAVAAYGGARFPCLTDRARTVAHDNQIEQYQVAAQGFPVGFERRIVTTQFHGSVVEVPVHILAEFGAVADTPVVVVTGGIDTWKMDLHRLWVAYVLGAHVRVVACDIPGTGELTHLPLTRDSTDVLDQVVSFARTLTTSKVGQLGLSFGGYFAAHAGLTKAVDAAVVVGGPVLNAFTAQNLGALIFGMRDVFGNAAGFSDVPTDGQLLDAGAPFAMPDLLAGSGNCPMLVLNGDQDPHVPTTDTLLFEGRTDTRVQLIAGGTHCAFNRIDDVIAVTTAWLSTALHHD